MTLKLLVIEDEALIAMQIEGALHQQGHSVVGVVDTLSDAMSAADRDRPDLALCDVKLGGGECGRTVAAALAERGIPCVFLSGNCPDEGGHPLVLGCVPKPFHVAGLAAAVRAAHAVATGIDGVTPPQGMRFY